MKKSKCRIEIIDSKFNSAGLGLVVKAAARKAREGSSLDEVIGEANRAVNQVRMFGIFETMEPSFILFWLHIVLGRQPWL